MPAGRVGRPHGLDGSFHVTRPGDAAFSGTVFVDGVERALERVAGTRERPILRVAGCSSRAEVEALRGASLSVLRDELPLGEGEFWASDLVGCAVVDGDRPVGVVSRMIALPSCEALEVGDVLIPMVRDAVRSVDVEARRIDVDMGFLGS